MYCFRTNVKFDTGQKRVKEECFCMEVQKVTRVSFLKARVETKY
jgi:hypothetical protein